MLKRLLSATVLFAAISAFSQGGPGGPGMDHGPMGLMGAMRTPVTNAPYSATFTTTSVEKLQDGSTLNHSSTRVVSRDSLGRTREEVTLPMRGSAAASTTPHTMIVILDPVARTVTQLRTEQKVAVVRALPEMGAGLHPFRGRPVADTSLPTTNALTSGGGAGRPHGPNADKNVVKADLGAQTISGVVATGTRTTRTVPVGEMGNTAPLISTHEEWFSPDLKIEVSRTDADPFHGTRTTKATSISKVEPDAGLFKVPAGYTIQQAAGRASGHRGASGSHRPGEMPPAPPADGVPATPPGI